MVDRYDPSRDITPDFLGRVAEWIERTGEVLVILRYLRAAGSKDFILCRSRSAFEDIVNRISVGTEVIVIRDPQLSLRGVVTEEFTRRVLAELPDGTEYLAVANKMPRWTDWSEPAWWSWSDSTEDLQEFLREFAGQEVAIGVCPDWTVRDDDRLTSASKGGIDGPR